ncbi:PAS domain S-box protein [Caenispirillum salinarum]|uniref:PAS domain S-box protein n=1 Tax=Caenispirillum salinarum TaxID=859058 RepID=UPI00384FF60E
MNGRIWQPLAVAGVAMFCLVLTALAWRYDAITGARVINLEFERGARRIERGLMERMHHLETTVRAAQGFVENLDVPDEEAWESFARRLDLGSGANGVVGLAFYRLEKGAARDGDAYLVALAAPNQRLSSLIGRPLIGAPAVLQAIREARASGEFVLSGRFEGPLQRAGAPVAADMVMVAPVHDPGSGAYRGVVALGLSSTLLLDSVFGRTGTDGYAVAVSDATAGAEPFYRAGAPQVLDMLAVEDAGDDAALRQSSAVVVGGRVWRLAVARGETLTAARLAMHGRVELVAGLAFTLVMTFAAWLLVTRRMRAEKLAAEMTEALKESEERYRMLFAGNKAVELVIDPTDGRIVEANAAAERFYGWPAEQLTRMVIGEINTLTPAEVAAEMRRAEEESRTDFIFRHRTASGAVRDVEVCSGPIVVQGRRLLYSIVHDITQRREAERALRDSEIRFRSLFEQSPWATLVLRPDGVIRRANTAWRALRGAASAPTNLLDDPQFAAHGFGDLLGRAGAGESVEVPAVLLEAGGGVAAQWVRAFLYPVRDATGAVDEVILMAEDITERVRAERELAYRHRLLATHLETTPDGVVILDGAWRIAGFNRRFAEMWNLAPDLLSGGDGQALLFSMRSAVEAPAAFEARMRALTSAATDPDGGADRLPGDADGAVGAATWDEITMADGRVFEAFSRMVPPTEEEPARRVWFYRDISERKRLEERLRRALDEQDAMFNSAGEGIAFLRGDRFVRANRVFSELFGYSAAELTECAAADMFPDAAGQKQFLTAVRAALETNGRYTGEHRMRRKDGTLFWCRTNGATLEHRSTRGGTIWLVEDITERREADRRLGELLGDLERSNAELQQFAYVASHDLQEPLRMVSSYMGLLERRHGGDLSEDAKEYIGFAVDGAHRMQGLINDLLQYSRVGTQGKPLEPRDATAAARAALDNLSIAVAEAEAEVSVGPLPRVMADEGQLVRLFQNLIGNALKYHKVGVAPHVTVSAARQEARMWRFSVADNGIGIEPKHFDRVFMIFQRLHARDEYSGTGIGLAICKKIVERHGGRIWLESEPGEGTTVHFTLRAAESGPGTAQPADGMLEPA